MDLLWWALLLSGGIYFAGVLWLWKGLGLPRPETVEALPSVSVIVAARDEQEALPGCLQALQGQDYQGPFEVVVVDDRSRDETWRVILEKAAVWSDLKGIRAHAELRFKCPKKSALAQGIEASSGDILLFTDADCQPPVAWVSSMVAHFAPGVGFVAGYARPDPVTGFVAKLLAVDNIAVGALGAGSIAMGSPFSCTGRNLGYRREVYDSVGGFSRIGHLVGGDDVYFMRLVAAVGGWQMVFNRALAVLSAPPATKMGDIVQQKIRHAAKGGHYRGGALYLAIGVYSFHFFIAWALLQMILTGEWQIAVMALWSMRWVVDLMLLWRMAMKTERWLLRYLLAVEVVYIPYVLIFTVFGRLGWFRWKS